MREIIAAACAAAGAVVLWKRKRIDLKGMLLVLLLAAAGVGYCLLEGFSGEWIPVSSITKGEKGSGSQKVELQVQTEGRNSQVTLEVPDLAFEDAEAEAEVSALLAGLDQEILGENISLTEVCYPLVLENSYGDSPVQVQWQTDVPDYLSWEGELGSSIPEEGAEVLLTGVLKLQDISEVYQRRIRVYPSKALEDLPGRIISEAEKLNEENDSENYLLPESLEDTSLRWYRVSDSTGWLVVCLALLLLAGQVLVKQERVREKRRTRQEQLDREYPELVTHMQMLLGAGLGMRMVLERIAAEYRTSLEQEEAGGPFRRKRKAEKQPVYEEILISCRELENGVSEAEVYRRLGNRCGTPSYRGLSLLLEQNMTKGGQGLLPLLETETLEAFETRMRKARQEGEKVSVRLLFPMGIMLVIVLALIMIPAFMTM